VGYNFTSDLLEFITSSRSSNSDDDTINRIYEVYGSRAESSLLSARPKFRIPDISRNDFAYHVRKLSDAGVYFDYTLNTSDLGSKSDIKGRECEVKEYIRFLVDCGVDCITVALPIMAQWIRDISQSVKIEVSTIAHIDTVTQAKIWKDLFGVNKICGALHKNRDFPFLRSLSNYCNKNDVELVLMVNEFCGSGVKIEDTGYCSATSCILRDHCYQLHSLDYNIRDVLDGDYPMGFCISSRNDSSAWLKMNFIRPEDLGAYSTIGINHFKVTGRTGSTSLIKRISNAYLAESYTGNLLDLWKHLETIGKSDDIAFSPTHVILNPTLDGFIEAWTGKDGLICANEVCGVSCDYCDKFFAKHCL